MVAILLATLNLAIPILDENTTVKIEEPPKRFLQFIEYEEPPTKQQYVIYWGLNALDIYTTYRALKNPNIIEGNPIKNKEALANPESLNQFKNIKELQY